MSYKVDLKNYTCDVPFTSLEIHNNVCFVCCPSWLPNKIEINDIPLKDLYNSQPIIDIRESIIDGSFKYCSKELCPHLSKVVNGGVTASGPVRLKTNYNHNTPIIKNNTPDYLVMNFDRTCNYKCPSCRVDLIVENSEGMLYKSRKILLEKAKLAGVEVKSRWGLEEQEEIYNKLNDIVKNENTNPKRVGIIISHTKLDAPYCTT